jgi:hypothetical protein
MVVVRLALALTIILAANGLAGAQAPDPAASLAGEAYVLAVGVPVDGPVAGPPYGIAVPSPLQPVPGSPYVALPPEGGSLYDFAPGVGVGTGGDVGNVDGLRVSTTGGPLGEGGTVTSTSEIGLVSLFAGLVRATNVQVTATTTLAGGRAFSSANVVFSDLTVAGIPYPSPRPNERVELPGLGYVVLNEQLVGGDGVNTSSIIVRAFRLQVTEPIVLNVPQFAEFVVGNASTGVPGISANVAVAAPPLPTATRVPFAAISTREPVDISIGDNRGSNRSIFSNENFDIDNDNDNSSGTGTASGATGGSIGGSIGSRGASGSPQSVLVTVVVVVATPTATPTPTPTRTPTSVAKPAGTR